jgi:nuclear GTP-binding protein
MVGGRGGVGGAASAADICKVGAKPGQTRDLKEVALEKGLKIIDSPGIIWGGLGTGDGIGSLNMVDVDNLPDVFEPVDRIVQRIPAGILQTTYSIPRFTDPGQFLLMIALSRGRLGKGGTPDLEATARSVLHDWNSGHIPYHTDPPVVHPSFVPMQKLVAEDAPSTDMILDNEADRETMMRTGDDVGSANIVSSYGQPFDLDGLWKLVDADVVNEEVDADGTYTGMEQPSDLMDDDDELPMESDHLASTFPASGTKPVPGVGRTAPSQKKHRQHSRYNRNAPDGLAAKDEYERGTMAKSRKRLREFRRRKMMMTS